MAKKVAGKVKLTIPGGQANPAPPVGPALNQFHTNIGEFVRQFNDRTKASHLRGRELRVEITVFEDNSFTFVVKSPPTAFLLKEAAGVERGSGEPNTKTVGSITPEQLAEIASIKM